MRTYESGLLLALMAAIGCNACKSSSRPKGVPPPPTKVAASVEVTPAMGTVEVEQTLQLTVRVLDADGAEIQKTVTWASENPGAATVSPAGLVTGIAMGGTTITATVDDKVGSTLVTVVPKNDNPVATVEIMPNSADLVVGESVSLLAVPKDMAGAVLTNRTVVWSSSNDALATVSQAGLVVGVAPGNVQITALVEGQSASIPVVVNDLVQTDGDVNLVVGTSFQTMTGWEGTAQIGQLGCQSYNAYKADLINRLINELGINRIRVEVRSGTENTSDWFTDFVNNPGSNWRDRWYNPINDNADPFDADLSRFHFSEIDSQVTEMVIPMQQALAARGEQLYVSLCYVDFTQDSMHRHNGDEYGELMLTTFQHFQNTYGFVPDGVEIILEPDNANWSANQLADALQGAGDRLAAAGYRPDFMAPSTVAMWNSVNMMSDIQQNAAAVSYVTEMVYHRYEATGNGAADAVRNKAEQLGIKTAMLEHINGDIDELWEDLTVVNASAWQQFALAFCVPSPGGDAAHYYEITENDPNNPNLYLRPESRPFAQIFRHVRLGAVRYATDVRDGSVRSMAFQNADGKWVVITQTYEAKTFTVGRLPPGTYGVDYTTDAELVRALPDITITNGDPVSLSIPAPGLITIFGK